MNNRPKQTGVSDLGKPEFHETSATSENRSAKSQPTCHKYPLVSVLIPSYNHAKFLENCLDSVLKESYPNKEIVIVNDGSKDNTEEVVNNWIEKNGDKITIHFRSRENKGLCATINELLEMVNGEYIISLASDDELRNDGIIKRYEYMRENPDKMAVISDSNVIDKDGNLIHNSLLVDHSGADKSKYVTDKQLKHEIITNFKLLGSILMIKSEVFEGVRYFDETISQEDRDMYLRLVSKNQLGFIDEVVSGYRLHGRNSSRTSALIKIQADTPKVLMKYFNVFKEYRFFIIKEIIYVQLHVFYLKIKYYLEENLKQENPPLVFMILSNFLYSAKNIVNKTLCFILNREA